MWHEARRSEKRVHEMTDAARKRAERSPQRPLVDYVAAGLCSIQLFLYSPDLRTAATHLQHAQLLFEKGTEARQNAAADLAASIGPLAAAGKRLTAPWSVALFGAPSDGRTSKRCVEVTEFLVEREFDLALKAPSRSDRVNLALQVINFLHLPAVQIYASVAALLAEKQQHRVLFEGLMDRIKYMLPPADMDEGLMDRIKYMLPPADMDEVIGAAVMVYTHTAVKLSTLSLTFTGRQDMSRSVKLPKEQIDRLIHMLSDEHK
ncbi:unnamed protein product [Closterium sp. NIES-64]|nr:unnamed protein product [Closterium sp. NIES-64]